MTPNNFLNLLLNVLHAESSELKYDYLTLHHTCWSLLRRVNDLCKPILHSIRGSGYSPSEKELPFVVVYIFETCTSDQIPKRVIPHREREVSAELLNAAAMAFNEMIETPAADVVARKMQKLGAKFNMSDIHEREHV